MANAYIDSKNNSIILHDKNSKLSAVEKQDIQEMTVAAGYSFMYLTDKIELYANNSEVIKLSTIIEDNL